MSADRPAVTVPDEAVEAGCVAVALGHRLVPWLCEPEHALVLFEAEVRDALDAAAPLVVAAELERLLPQVQGVYPAEDVLSARIAELRGER